MELETSIWALGVLIVTGVLLLLGSETEQKQYTLCSNPYIHIKDFLRGRSNTESQEHIENVFGSCAEFYQSLYY